MKHRIKHRYRLLRLWLKRRAFLLQLWAYTWLWKITMRIQRRIRPFLMEHDPMVLYVTAAPTVHDRYSGRLPR